MDKLSLTEEELDKKLKNEANKPNVEFETMVRTKPLAGTVLDSLNGGGVRIFEDFKISKEGHPVQLMYCNATVDEDATGWYLHDEPFGLKCIIIMDQDLVSEDEDGKFVYSLEVLGLTKSKKAIKCKVME